MGVEIERFNCLIWLRKFLLPLKTPDKLFGVFYFEKEVSRMFTGIVEELGLIKSVKKSVQSMELTIAAKRVLKEVKIGDSIAVNGVCLTVKSFNNEQFIADVMPETVHATNFKFLENGLLVNLERAMSAQDRFDGHIVSGHIDGTATILRKRPISNAVYIDLSISKELLQHCIVKGSIAIDGTSLTLFDVTKTTVTVSLIPHTYKETLLGKKKVGETVNIETDLFSKYVAKHLSNHGESKINAELLIKAGF